MPIIIDPDIPPPTPPVEVTSPDGLLTARRDDPWAGVFLTYDVNVPPAIRNRVLNPALTVGLTNTVSVGSVTRVWQAAGGVHSAGRVECTSTGAASGGTLWLIDTVAAGETIHFSAWVKVPGSGLSDVYVIFRNGGTTLSLQSFTPPAAGSWVRVTRSYTVAVGQTVDRCGVGIIATGAGTIWSADSAQAEIDVTAPSNYVDGSLAGCAWEGAANASASVYPAPLDPDDIAQVRFVRQDPGAAEPVRVRGGDPAWAPGGVAVAYDHEAPLGVASAWYAYPIGWDGTVGARSDGAAVTLPEPTPVLDVWLKSLTDPALSMLVKVMAWPELQYGERQQRFDVLGASSPVMRVDAWSLPTSTVTIETDTLDERTTLLALLTSGTTLLAQTRAEYGRADTYWVPGQITEVMPGIASDPHRTWTVTVTAVDRPTTVDSPLRIPGRSYDDSGTTWPTYADRIATGQTYHEVTTGG
ncbi:hypothetical protein OHA37_27095 [Streptomyces sp. NBC_00335]|uniref:hypothetical protein n=1 Tax=unclassified Streptomyces TaxID=2593676 RepID=UPI002254BF8F|nr:MULTISPECIES: hypothetical protein [unclassified Streptomyces]MCX5407518.1 hypothetical protein [Streptomyces sp. NBC_00086]